MNELETDQEHHTWKVMENTMSQLRTAGMTGHPVGLDHLACTRMAEALGFDPDSVLELLPYAEMGMLKGMRKRMKEKETVK